MGEEPPYFDSCILTMQGTIPKCATRLAHNRYNKLTCGFFFYCAHLNNIIHEPHKIITCFSKIVKNFGFFLERSKYKCGLFETKLISPNQPNVSMQLMIAICVRQTTCSTRIRNLLQFITLLYYITVNLESVQNTRRI